ncbi:hypothetical protein, partial [Microbacterium sp. C7(2022)]|uniref:hypothetical protein n=1 Tax=Microbacterium sp. C7(2022) TaxID=2992759 RepID=UPI00237ACF9B
MSSGVRVACSDSSLSMVRVLGWVRRRPLLTGALALALVATGAVVAVRPWDQPANAAACAEGVAATATNAAALAVDCGREVEVLSDRSPWVTVYAQPDGLSKMTVDAVPSRTRVNGDWQPVDVSVAPSPVASEPADTSNDPSAMSGLGHGAGGVGASVSMARTVSDASGELDDTG